MITHAEASDLLGAYALDAVDADEVAALEEHLRSCPRCRDELRGHREVVGLLAYSGQDAPSGLWDRVAARLNADPDELTGSPGPTGPGATPMPSLAPPGSSRPSLGEGARASRPRRPAWGGSADDVDGYRGYRGRPRWVRGRVLPVLAAAAVIIVAVLGVEVARLEGRTNQLSGQVASMSGVPSAATVKQALAATGERTVLLQPEHPGGPVLEAVILPGGQGYLFHSTLAPLPASQTYQLWGVVGAQRVSYGVLGSQLPAFMAFRASSGVQYLAVTTEPAGGVVVSREAPVVVGAVS